MIMGFIISTLLLLLLLLLLWFGSSSGLNSDGALLLSFRYSVLSDPLSVLDDWVYTDETPCSWTGITCAQIGVSPGSPEMYRVTGLHLPNSQLLGSIPDALGFLQHLRQLDLSGNFLNGTLPASLFNASELQVLFLSNNKISGEIPDLSAGPTRLQVLNLSENALAGKVPENLTAVRSLTVVSLRSNYFSGRIPSGFDFVEVLDLSSNLFNGSLPDDFGGENLRYLNLSYNKLSGSVNSEFAEKIPANASIDLSFNNLTGEIPQLLALLNQKTDSFAGNVDLCGKPLKKLCTIPSTLSIPPNNGSSASSSPAIAAIPKTVDSNAGANSNQPNGTSNQPQRRLKPATIAGITVGDLAGIGVLAMIFLYVYKSKKKKKNKMNAKNSKANITNKDQANVAIVDELSLSKDHPKTQGGWSCLNIGNGDETSEATGSDSDGSNRNGDGVVEAEEVGKEGSVLVMVDGETKLEEETLLKASAYVLGSSGRSIVYKAVVEGGVAFAVRRIGDGGVRRLRDFETQVRAVAKLRHPNLVRVRGFYWGSDEKLVIYDYISNGSLASVSGAGGYKKTVSSPSHLSFDVRLKIARGLARGLAFIHEKKAVHGNIKPANILLTPDMEPVISDLGLDRLLPADTHRPSSASATCHFGSKRSAPSRDDFPAVSPYSTPTDFVGSTSLYHAPESLENLKPSPKWDVYSFGILLLELLTGRVFSERELSAGAALEDRTRLARMAGAEDNEDSAIACLKLGFSCAALAPQRRPSMKEALQVLDKMPSSPFPY